jgi:SOS-response transcriptional repressor LexA
MTTTDTPPTARQAAVLAAIVRHMATHGGQCPTVRELMAATGITSPNGIVGHLLALEKRGLVVPATADGPAQARGVRVRGLADALEAAVKAWAKENGVEL